MKDRKRNPDSRKNIVFNIQSIILSVLMAISLVTIIVMGLLLYHRFKLALEKTAVDNTEATVEATVDRLNADLLDIRQILKYPAGNSRSSSVCSMRPIPIRFRAWLCMTQKEI